MWCERSVEEKRTYMSQRRRNRIYLAIIATIAVTIGFSLFRSGIEAANSGRSYFVTEISDIPMRVPGALICGLFVGVVTLLVYGKQSTMICSSCGESKRDDGNTVCVCGGLFRDIHDIKWVDNPEPPAGSGLIVSITQAVAPIPKNKNT